MKLISIEFGVILALCTAVHCTDVEADTLITLGFDTLPSAQGWEFLDQPFGNHADDVEFEVFSVSASTLTMNTMGDGFQTPSGIGYENTGVVDPTLTWTVEWTSKTVAYEKKFPTQIWDFGAQFQVYNGESVVGVAVSDEGISVTNGGGITRILRDNTGFQNFRVKFTPDLNTGVWELFVDDASILSGAGRPDSLNQLFIGDGTGAGNSQWDMTSYEFCQPSCDILEPTTIALDIKPGSNPNSVNLTDKGVLPVAVLSSEVFNPSDIDIDTLWFGDPLLTNNGGTAVRFLRSSLEDITGDGILDLSLKFSMAEMMESEALGPDTIEGLLTGALFDGTSFAGSDSIRIVPPNGSNGNSLQVSAVPEPATWTVLLFGVMTMLCRRNQSSTEKYLIERKIRVRT